MARTSEAKKKKGAPEESKVHPYDFSLKRSIKNDKSDVKPIKPQLMAPLLIKAHGLKKALQIAEPLTIESFKDPKGNPISINESSKYWKSVVQILRKGTNATTSK